MQKGYLTPQEHLAELAKQVAEQRRLQMAEKFQDQQENLRHYDNYKIGGSESYENPSYKAELASMVQNRTQYIDQQLQQFGGAASKNTVPFSGDMNANKGPSGLPDFNFQNNRPNPYDDNFLNQNAGNFKPNDAPSSNNTDITAANERERRIRLREIERAKRNPANLIAGAKPPIQQESGYGVHLNPAQNQGKSQIFHDQSAANKRDEIWQQKMVDRQQQQYQAAPVNIHLPIHNAPALNFVPSVGHNQPLSSIAQMSPRSSLKAHQFQAAKDLDISLNTSNQNDSYEQFKQDFRRVENTPMNLPPKPSPIISNQKQQAVVSQGGLDSQIGNSELQQKLRRDQDRAQKQKEYNDFIANQPQRGRAQASSANPENRVKPAATERSSSKGVAVRDSSFQNGGLQQIGGHQFKQIEDKARLQQEYRNHLDKQKDTRNVQVGQSQELRRKAIVDQVFQEMVQDSERKLNYNPLVGKQDEWSVPPQQNLQKQGLPPRIQSAVGTNRKSEVQKLQEKSYEDPFFKNKSNEDSIKRQELEKKRQYAAQLQQQIERKNSEFTKKPASQNQPQVAAQLPMQFQNQQYMPQNFTPSYQEQNFVPNQYAIPDSFQAQVQQFHPRSRSPVEQRYAQQHPVQNFQPESNVLVEEKRRQAEYKRQLDEQVRLREEQKLKHKEDQFQYEKIHDRDTASYVQPVQPTSSQVVPPGVRKATDVTSQKDPTVASKQAVIAQYQEDLRRQIEEKKAKKDEQTRQQKQEEQEEERKLAEQRNDRFNIEKKELLKEGKKESDFEQKDKHVNRSQFEPSAENNLFGGGRAQVKQPSSSPKPTQDTTDWLAQKSPMRDDPFGLHGNAPAQQQPRGFPNSPHRHFGASPTRANNFMQEGQSQPTFTAGFGVNQSNFQMPAPHPQHQQLQPQFFQPSPLQVPSFNSQITSPLTQQMQPDPQWAAQAQAQQTKMFEDQQRMIQLYQQALEQILQFRNQYFEQAMEMRTNIVKEREQLLEYEKVKQQQALEIQQLKAVQGQLDGMLEQSQRKQPGQNRTPVLLNAQVQSNLNNFIHQQKEQLLMMSQSSSRVTDAIRQAGLQAKNQNNLKMQTPKKQQNDPLFDLPVSTSRVQVPLQVPRQQQCFSPMSNDFTEVNAQVDQLAQAIEQSAVLPDHSFEQSLSSNSKLVKIPANNLAQKALEMQASNKNYNSFIQSPDKGLMQTWTEQNASAINISDQRSPTSAVKPRSPFIPEVIKEEPTEEEHTQKEKFAKLLRDTQVYIENERKREALNVSAPRESQPDFNNRDDSLPFAQDKDCDEFGPESPCSENQKKLPHKHDESVSAKGSKNQQFHQFSSITHERRAANTGSSFYEATLKNQRQKKEEEQEEMQKQLMRIFGDTHGTLLSLDKMQPEVEEEKQDDIVSQSEINIAATMNTAQGKRFEKQRTSAERDVLKHFEDDGIEEDLEADADNEPPSSVWDDPDMIPKNISRNQEEDSTSQVENSFPTDDHAGNLAPYAEYLRNTSSEYEYVNKHKSSRLTQMTGTSEVQDKTILGLDMLSPHLMSGTDYRERGTQEILIESQEDQNSYHLPNVNDDQYPDDYEDQSDFNIAKSKVDESVSQSQISKKDRDMMEIAALIRKATAPINDIVEKVNERKHATLKAKPHTRVDKLGQPQNWLVVPKTADVVSTTQHGSSGLGAISEKTLEHQFTNEHTVSSRQEEEEKVESIWATRQEAELPVKKEEQIMQELEKIISNLETQQKNMQTFGLPERPSTKDFGSREKQATQIVEEEESEMMIIQENTMTAKNWQTLQQAREERSRPVTAASTSSRRDIPRPKSNKRNTSGQREPSPLTAGKYAQMAREKSPSQKSNTNCTQSPQRIGKYSQMALNASPLKQSQKGNNTNCTQSPQRIGKFAQMALNASPSQSKGNNTIATSSPQRIGKYAAMALQHSNAKDNANDISIKYSRRLSSKERGASNEKSHLDKTQEEQDILQGSQSILRPISGKSNSMRYGNHLRSKASPDQNAKSGAISGFQSSYTAQTLHLQQSKPVVNAYDSDEDDIIRDDYGIVEAEDPGQFSVNAVTDQTAGQSQQKEFGKIKERAKW